MAKPFQFKEFAIQQDKTAMKIGTDAVLLGAWCSVENFPDTILDIGAGTGIISLMLAQRSDAQTIDAVEVDENAYEQTVDNFENSKILVNDIDYLNSAAKQIKESGLYVAPTLVIFEMILQYLDEEKFAELQKHPESNYLTRGEYEKYLTEKNHYRAELMGIKIVGIDSDEFFKNFFIWMKKFTKILNEHQVPLLTGSDTFGMVVPGFSIHKEFEFLQDAGLSPYDILKASTINAARYLNTFSMEGTISEGKNANLVLLNKNPLDNIKNATTIEGVMLKGKWYDREKLNKMLNEVELTNNKN